MKHKTIEIKPIPPVPYSEQEAKAWSSPNFRTKRTIKGLTLFIKNKLNLHGARAIDVGCGSGIYSFVLMRRAHSVVGLDAAPEMLSIAKKCDKSRSLQLVRGDYFHLPFKNKSFDVAVSLGPSIMGHEKNSLALKELWRILKPGSKAVLDVKNPLHLSYWLPNPFYNFLAKKRAAILPQQLRLHLEENGFKSIEISSVNYIPPACPHFLASFFEQIEKIFTKLPYLKFLGRHLVVLVTKS